MSQLAGKPPNRSAIQEDENKFPYHYIPAIRGRDIAYSVAVDWAADYLNGIELVRSLVLSLAVKQLCDVGCGDGRLINELSVSCPNVLFRGIDVSARALALANSFRTRPNAHFRELDLLNQSAPDLLDNDLVTLIEVLEHVPPEDAVAFLRRVYSLVRAGGTLLVTVPHTNVPVSAKHYRHFTGKSLLDLLRTALGATPKLEVRYMDEVEVGLNLLASKLARNRYFSIEPLFQWRLRRRLGIAFVSESVGSRAVATITKPLA